MARTKSSLPAGARALEQRHPMVWESFEELGKRCAEAGPLDSRTIRLVKLALATGAGLEGAVHSQIRRALKEGLSVEELRHVALLAIPTLGLSTAVRTTTWMDDVLNAKTPKGQKRTKR